jgi:transposase
MKAPRKKKRKTYRQNWRAYNAAQTNERDRFLEILYALCARLQIAPLTVGRPPIPLPDSVFLVIAKVYEMRSGRRSMPYLKQARRDGWISKCPKGPATIFNVMKKESLTDILLSLIESSAMLLSLVEDHFVEVDFAIDSTGFSTSTLDHWNHRGEDWTQHKWLKCHLCCGVRSNIVTAVVIDEPTSGDAKFLPPLLDATLKHFDVSEVSADKAYSSRRNLEAAAVKRVIPFIAFRDNAVGGGDDIWSKMLGYLQSNPVEFREHFHKRSNVESTISMIKRLFGDTVRSRKDPAMKNEVLCKIGCHNICVLIHEFEEAGLSPIFWPAEKAAA